MVLSHKKLKQKFRSLLVESLAATEPGKSGRDGKREEMVSKELQNLRQAISANKGMRTRPPRKKKKKKAIEEEQDSRTVESTVDGKHNPSGVHDKHNRTMKMKKEVKGVSEQGDSNQHIEKEKKNSNKKAKKKKKKEKEKRRKEKKEPKNKTKEDDKSGDETKGSLEHLKPKEGEDNGEAAKKVYVGGIPYYSSEDDIRSFFESCGTISEMHCMTFPESGKFRGIAILTFKTEAAAKRAFALDGADMGGFYLKILPYKFTRYALKELKSGFTPEVIEGYNRVYVGNLSWDITEKDLRNLFLDCNISAIRFGEDKVTKEFKGYAHVDFKDSVSLTLALKLDQQMVCGRPVKISCAVPAKIATKTNMVARKNVDMTDAEKSNYLRSEEVLNESGVSSATTGNAKKKRRTCYECGIPGHLSSECPNKKSSNTAMMGNIANVQNEVYRDGAKMSTAEMGEKHSSETENQHTETTASHGNTKKKKRRTCYECGIPGHLSTECPTKKTCDHV